MYMIRAGVKITAAHLYHITKTRPCNTHWFFTAVKIIIFKMKKFDIFLIFAVNIDRGYTLEPPQ